VPIRQSLHPVRLSCRRFSRAEEHVDRSVRVVLQVRVSGSPITALLRIVDQATASMSYTVTDQNSFAGGSGRDVQDVIVAAVEPSPVRVGVRAEVGLTGSGHLALHRRGQAHCLIEPRGALQQLVVPRLPVGRTDPAAARAPHPHREHGTGGWSTAPTP